jgi:hypothetical protein
MITTTHWIMPLKMEIGSKWQHRPLLLLRRNCHLDERAVLVLYCANKTRKRWCVIAMKCALMMDRKFVCLRDELAA